VNGQWRMGNREIAHSPLTIHHSHLTQNFLQILIYMALKETAILPYLRL